jgi:hypothetical protein
MAEGGVGGVRCLGSQKVALQGREGVEHGLAVLLCAAVAAFGRFGCLSLLQRQNDAERIGWAHAAEAWGADLIL